ncbi:hypothetical protein DH2020_011545 [Rehmannia glutinosa]|uniref:DUF674 family protein n=1 Tax=Rehmannia glutinosa TaxID=99300 RepID=A0ABR0XDR6_REHGL
MSDSDGEEVKLSLKVMINKQKSKVLFAEADSNFTDVLLSFLTLPLGTIVRVLKNHYGDKTPIIGSLTSLCKGLSNLDWQCWSSFDKFTLLNPVSSLRAERDKLKLSVDGTKPVTSVDTDFKRKSKRSRKASVSKPQVADGGGFTVKTESFVITDDLQIEPVVAGSIIRTLIKIGITETDGAELRNLTLGFNEIMDLLKGSLLSQTPLTDLIFIDRAKTNCVTGSLLQQVKKEESSSSSSRKMTVRAMVQKSTNKILFVEAKGDFVDFLCSFLTIPLGGVECLLGGNACLKNIDNLYKSIANVNGDKYLKTKETKAMLLKPKLSHLYNSVNHFLPFIEKGLSTSNSSHVSPGGGKIVKGERMYVVTDDLTVTPFCMASSFSVLSRLKIPLSDVNELELEIGLDEKNKVLFAEADSEFADVLLSFLTLPLGTIVRVLKKHYGDKAPVIGGLNTLYKDLANLDNVYFWTEGVADPEIRKWGYDKF